MMNNLNTKKFSIFSFITGLVIVMSILYTGVRFAVTHAIQSSDITVTVKEYLYECEGVK